MPAIEGDGSGDKMVPGTFATAEEAALARVKALNPALWAARSIK